MGPCQNCWHRLKNNASSEQRAKKHLLLEENGAETSVECTDTLVLEHLAETADETVGVGGLGDETDTGSLKRAQGNVGEELAGGGGGEVDGSTVVGGSLVAEHVDGLLLEEFVTTELEGTLEEVTGGGRTETSQESASTLILNDLAEAANHTTVVGLGVKLDTGLDAAFERLLVNLTRVVRCIVVEVVVLAIRRLLGKEITTAPGRWQLANECRPRQARPRFSATRLRCRSRRIGAIGASRKSLTQRRGQEAADRGKPTHQRESEHRG